MMEMTIIIPVYNREALLPRTLASVVAQTYRPLQVILVDNGSTDASMTVLQDFEKQHSSPDFKVTVCSEPTPGAPAARNAGLCRATTEWVMFFDSDDEMAPQLIANYVATITGNPEADLVYTDVEIVDEHGVAQVKRSPRKIDAHFLCGHIFHTYLSTQRYVVRRRLLEAVGGWNPALLCWNDWELGIRLLLHTSRLTKLVVARPQVLVHAHDDSITGVCFSDKVDALLVSIEAAERAVGASKRSDKIRLMRCIAYKKTLLAALCTREGSPRGAQLFAETRQHLASLWLRLLFAAGYRLACRGIRGTSRVVELFLRCC